ncbi:hypothetical protein BOX15_Mlig011643g1 [Macrostomum lignano]|uniref:Uncharacterized protein n=1 Tax=Macrostomum lignano TaxID=282301 RepID=A0A267EF61_9PLAT|nr:hypothetical protein BOX15_Mlig011643g1 [Macrostomum lignano]
MAADPTAKTFDGTAGAMTESAAAELVSTAYNVDHECRRLGYPPVVLRRPRGSVGSKGRGRGSSEFVYVPALLKNCAALLALLDAAPQRIAAACLSAQLAPPPPPQQQKQQECLDTNTSAAKSSRKPASRLRHLLSSRFNRKPPAAATATAEAEAAFKAAMNEQSSNSDREAAEEVTILTVAGHRRSGMDSMSMAEHLQQLLSEVRQGAERLSALVGLNGPDESGDSWLPANIELTPLQQEVLYFQVQWPVAERALTNKLVQSERTIRHLVESSAARGRAEIGARARSAARMASMEAELLRLRGEIRRCGRHRPPTGALPSVKESKVKKPTKASAPGKAVGAGDS